MGKSLPLAIGPLEFPTKTAANAYFKAMLNRYKPRDRVLDDDAAELALLLERHSEYADKVGSGVDHYEVMMTEHGSQCFRIVRTDGTGTDFSYIHCINGKPPSRKQEVSAALRRVVRYDLFDARNAFLKQHQGPDGLVACAVTGERILPDQGHMDHRPPMTFEVIVTTFLEANGLGFEQVPITVGHDEQTAPDLTDAALVERFRAFHNKVARLDFVKDTVNLAQSSRARLRPTRISLT